MNISRKTKNIRANLLVLMLSVTGAMRLYAFDFSAVCSTGQTLYFNITDETNHYVEVTYPGWEWSTAWPSFMEKPTGRLVLPETVSYEGSSYIVTSISSGAFYGCQDITAIIFSNSIIKIGGFRDWGETGGAFQGCIGLSEITFGNSLTQIGDETFWGCENLTTISIPETVTRVGKKAFYLSGWYNQQEQGILYLSNCCLGYKGPQPTGNLNLDENTRVIADQAFSGCTGLTGMLVIPNTVTHIGNYAFSTGYEITVSTGFTSVRFGNSLSKIGDRAFSECSNLTGDLIFPNSLTTIGDWAFSRCSGLIGELVIPNSVTMIGNYVFSGCSGLTGNLVIPSSVTSIGDGAFSSCSGLTGELVVPNSVTTIGEGAFSGCSGFIGNLIIPNSVATIASRTFKNCSGFTGNLIIPDNVTTIGESAFEGCCGFEGNLVIPGSIISIGKSAFKDCSNVSQIIYNTNNVQYVAGNGWVSDPPFENCNFTLTIGDNIRSIPSYLFKNSGLTGDIIIPSSVIEIGDAAFHNCEEITSVTISNSVTSVGNNAFADCSGLTTVNVSNTTISDGMFSDCTNLSSVVFSGPTFSIGREAFKNCSALTSITIPNSVQQIGSKAFANCSSLQTIAYNAVSCNIEQSWLEGCSAFEELNIGNGVQVIPRYSFFNCVGLNSVVLPETITTIGDFAFKGCSGLTAINIPNTVTSIGNKAFFDCQGLTSVILPASLNTMGTFAFGNCSRLTSVYYQAEQLESGSLPFDGCPSLATVYIDPCVRVIGSEVFRNCQTVHFIVALGDTPAVLEVNAFADIANNSVLMVPCGKQVTYFSSWNMFPYNSIIEDCSTYGINVGTIGNGGSVSSSVAEARMGQEVQLTITPDPGMNLSMLKVCNASDPTQIIPIAFMGKADSFYKFTMPSFEVVVLAAFASNTAVEDNLEKLFPVIVYPNPTKDVIKIKAENIHQITISNMLGQIIYVGRVDGSEVDYNFSGEESGIYLVSVETNRGVSVKKVLVSR